MKRRIRPGDGWSVVPGCVQVFDHRSGMRLHTLGLLRLSDGSFVRPFEWPTSRLANLCIAACGGNKKRGLMAWAMIASGEA